MRTLPRASAAAAILVLVIGCSEGGEQPPPDASAPRAVAALRPTVPPPRLDADTSPPPPAPADDEITTPRKDSVHYPVDSAGRLTLPVVIERACEGEDCRTEFEGVACEDGVLQAEHSVSAPIVASMHRLDTLQVTVRNMYVIPGVVVMRRDTLGWARGDTLWLLRYYELGLWQWWSHGSAWSGPEFWRGPKEGLGGAAGRDTTGAVAIALSAPGGSAWLKVQTRKGHAGWWRVGTPGRIGDVMMMQHWGERCEDPPPEP